MPSCFFNVEMTGFGEINPSICLKSVASQVQYGIPENLSNLLSVCGLCTLEAREREGLTVQERGAVLLYFASASQPFSDLF